MSRYYGQLITLVSIASLASGVFLRYRYDLAFWVASVASFGVVVLVSKNWSLINARQYLPLYTVRFYVVCRFGDSTLVSRLSGSLPNVTVGKGESDRDALMRVSLFGYYPFNDQFEGSLCNADYLTKLSKIQLLIEGKKSFYLVHELDSRKEASLKRSGLPYRFVADAEVALNPGWMPLDTLIILTDLVNRKPQRIEVPGRELDPHWSERRLTSCELAEAVEHLTVR